MTPLETTEIPSPNPEPSAWIPAETPALPNRGPVKNAVSAAAEARLVRFVQAYVETGGNKAEAARKAGCMGKNSSSFSAAGVSLYKKAIARGLLKEAYVEGVEKPLGKEDILQLLTDQAAGKRPASRVVRSMRNKDGYMREVETKVTYDEAGAAVSLAKILGLFSDAPKAPTINILQVLGQLPEEQRAVAEAEIIRAHGLLLEAQPQGEAQKNG